MKTTSGPLLLVHGGAGNWNAATAPGGVDGCRTAARHAWEGLQKGGSAVDAVELAVRLLEDDPRFNAGYGSVANADGVIRMDASIMASRGRHAGAVAGIRHYRNPVCLARAVMEDGRHVLLVGDGAEAFAETVAESRGLLTYEPSMLQSPSNAGTSHETVGAVAVDRDGLLAAATSTGGRHCALPGRVGDSPLIGAGTWADDRVAISCTGIGEAIIKAGLARHLAALVSSGYSPGKAARQALNELILETGFEAGLIAVSREGRWARIHNAAGMATCRIGPDQRLYSACLGNDEFPDDGIPHG